MFLLKDNRLIGLANNTSNISSVIFINNTIDYWLESDNLPVHFKYTYGTVRIIVEKQVESPCWRNH